MAKTRRRVLSILMALVLTLGLLPTSALAGPWGPGGGGGQSGNATDATFTLNSNSSNKVTVYYAYVKSTDNTFSLQTMTPGEELKISDFSTSHYGGYILFFAAPADDYLLTGMYESNNYNQYNYYAIDNVASSEQYSKYHLVDQIVAEAKAKGAKVGFGYSRGVNAEDNVTANFTFAAAQGGLTVSATSLQEEVDPVVGEQVEFKVTASLQVPNNVTPGTIQITSMKVNGSPVDYSKNSDGTYSVKYTLEASDIMENQVTLDVEAEVSYTAKITVGSAGETITTNMKVSDSARTSVQIAKVAKLKIEKTASPTTVNAGGEVTYTIKVTNTGDGQLKENFKLTDCLDDSLQFKLATCFKNPSGDGKNFVWEAGKDLQPGASLTATISVTVKNDASGKINNAVVVESKPDGVKLDPDSDLDVDIDVIGKGDLTISKTFTAETQNDLTTLTGSTGGFTISVTGPNSYNNTLNTGTTGVVSGEIVEGSGTVSQIYTWTLEDLAVGEYTVTESHTSAETDYNVTYDPQNKSREVDLTPAGAEVSFANTYVLKKPGVGLTKSVDKTEAKAGETIQYTIGVYNDGTLDATDPIVITDVLDGNLTLDTTSALPEGVNYDETTRTITWTLDEVPKGSSAEEPYATIKLSAKISEEAAEGTVITNQAAYGAITSDSVTTTVVAADVTIEKKAMQKGVEVTAVRLNEEFQYQLVVTNSGTADATNVTVVDIMPSGSYVEYKSSTATAGSYSNGVWNIGTLAEGASATLTITVKAVGVADDVTNTAVVKVDGETVHSDTATVDILDIKDDVVVTKTFSGTSALPEGFQITVAGTGVEETLTVNNCDAGSPTVSGEDTTYTWTIEDVPYNTELTLEEENYNKTGYGVTTSAGGEEDVTEAQLTVTEGEDNSVAFVNTYTSKTYTIVFDPADYAKVDSYEKTQTYEWFVAGEGSWVAKGLDGSESKAIFQFTQGDLENTNAPYMQDAKIALTDIVVGATPNEVTGITHNGKFYTDKAGDGFTTLADAVDVMNGSDAAAHGVTFDADGNPTITYTASYTFRYSVYDFGTSADVVVAYLDGEGNFQTVQAGTYADPVLADRQGPFTTASGYQSVTFFVKAVGTKQLSETASLTIGATKAGAGYGRLTKLGAAELEDGVLQAATDAGYTHCFTVDQTGFGAGFQQFFKIEAYDGAVAAISVTKTVTRGGNRAPTGTTTFTFNMEGYYTPRYQAMALAPEADKNGYLGSETLTIPVSGIDTVTRSFETYKFTREGTYRFYVTEENDNTSNRWRYDDTVYAVTFEVEANEGGVLEIVDQTIVTLEVVNGENVPTAADAVEFENVYTRIVNDIDNGDDGDEEIPDENPPTTDLPDENTPTTELPDEQTPTTENPDDTTELPDEETPLADVPETGDSAGVWVLAAGVSGLALVWLALTGKKRRDENA